MSVKESSDSHKKPKECKILPLGNKFPDRYKINSATEISFFYGPDLLYVQATDSHIRLGIAGQRILMVSDTYKQCCIAMSKFVQHITVGISLNIIRIINFKKTIRTIFFDDGSSVELRKEQAKVFCKLFKGLCE